MRITDVAIILMIVTQSVTVERIGCRSERHHDDGAQFAPTHMPAPQGPRRHRMYCLHIPVHIMMCIVLR